MLLLPIGGNVNWCSHHGEQYGGLLKLKIELPHDLEIPLLGIYPEETILQKDTCRAMFRSALFRIVKASKQPKCLSTIEGINKMPVAYTHTHVHTHSGILLLLLLLSHFSHVRLCATPSLGFSRQEHWSGLPFTMEYYSAIKESGIMPFAAACMGLEIIILTEVSQKKTNIVWYYYLWNLLKNYRNEFIYITERDSQTLKTNLWLPKGKGEGRNKLGIWG